MYSTQPRAYKNRLVYFFLLFGGAGGISLSFSFTVDMPRPSLNNGDVHFPPRRLQTRELTSRLHTADRVDIYAEETFGLADCDAKCTVNQKMTSGN